MDHIQKFVDEINRCMAQRQQLDLQAVYERFAVRYPGALSMEHGDAAHGEDFDILRGTSPAGVFELWDNGLDIIFDVTRPDGSCTHWHPLDMDEVVDDIEAFLQGSSKY